MLRLLFRLIILVVIFALIRYVVTTVARVFSQVMRPQAQQPPPRQQAPGSGVSGELKQDPVCGTFVATASSVKKTVNGELLHFCSVACRDKFKVA
jgi:YHS domain-containing protein